MRSVKILIIGQPIVYRGAGFIKYLTRKNKEMDNFSSVIRHGFYVDIFSWNKRIAQPIGIMKVYLVDGLKILFTLIRKVMCYDVIIAPQYPSLVEFFSALVGSKVKNNILIIRETHWYWPQTTISRLLWPLYFIAIKHVDGLIVPGKKSLLFWRRLLKNKQVHLVHFYGLEALTESVDERLCRKFLNKLKLQNVERPVFLYLGRMIYKKAPDIILKAFKKFVDKYGCGTLILAGTGDMLPNLIELAQKLGISSKVRFLGAIREKYKPCLYKYADVFIYVPRYQKIPEEWGIAPLEALCQGLPSIVSDIVGSIPDLKVGILVVEQNKDEPLAEKMAEALSKKSELIKKADQICKELVNPINVYAEFLRALRSIISDKNY